MEKQTVYVLVRNDNDHSSVVVPEEYEVECFSTNEEEIDALCKFLNDRDRGEDPELDDEGNHIEHERFEVEVLQHCSDSYYTEWMKKESGKN